MYAYVEYYQHYCVTTERTKSDAPKPNMLNTDGIGEEIFFINVNAGGSYVQPCTMQHKFMTYALYRITGSRCNAKSSTTTIRA